MQSHFLKKVWGQNMSLWFSFTLHNCNLFILIWLDFLIDWKHLKFSKNHEFEFSPKELFKGVILIHIIIICICFGTVKSHYQHPSGEVHHTHSKLHCLSALHLSWIYLSRPAIVPEYRLSGLQWSHIKIQLYVFSFIQLFGN